MKSTSSAPNPRKIAEFCNSRLKTIFTEGEVRLLYSCLVDLLERAEYTRYGCTALRSVPAAGQIRECGKDPESGLGSGLIR